MSEYSVDGMEGFIEDAEETAPLDYSEQFSAIERAIKAMDFNSLALSKAKAISSLGNILIAAAQSAERQKNELRGDLQDIAAAVKSINTHAADLSIIAAAITQNTAALDRLIKAMTAPKVLTFDARGEPNGLRIEKLN